MYTLLDSQNPLVGLNLAFLVVFVILAVVVFICFSGFVKFSVVLNIIKNAIGTQQIPPTIVVNILASVMALHSFYPYVKPGLERIEPFFTKQEKKNNFSNRQVAKIDNTGSIYQIIKNPFVYFPEILEKAKLKTKQLNDLINIPIDLSTSNIAYFIGSLLFDLYKGFELGLKLYLVFVTIDFLVAIILNASGMNMLSPTVISIPIKLAIFYLSDSWTILFKALE